MTLKEFFIKVGIKLDDAQFSKVETMLGGIKKAAVAFGAAAAAAGAAIGATVASAASDANEVEKLAKIMGVTTDAAQELGYVAAQSGVNLNDMTQLAAELAENIGEAASGTGEAADAFASLGINTRDSKGKLREVDDVLFEIADKFKELPNGQKKTAALTGLFGEEGIKLVGVLNNGGDAMRALAQEARDLGLVIEEDNIKAGAEATRQWNSFVAILNSVKQAVAGPIIFSLLELADSFKEWWKINQNLVKQRVDRIFRVLAAVLKPVLYLMLGIAKAAGFVIDNFEAIAAILGGVLLAAILLNVGGVATLIAGYIAAGAAAVASGIAATAAWVAANLPFIALAVLFALIILLAEDLYTWLSGGDSLIGALWEKWKGFIKDWLKPDGDDGFLMRALKKLLSDIIFLAENWDLVVQMMRDDWNSFVQWASDLFWGMIYGIADGVSYVLDLIPGVDMGADPEKAIKRLTGSINAQFGNGATPQATAAGAGMLDSIKGGLRSLSASFKSEIKIDGAKDPAAVGKEVEQAEGRFWDSKMRELEAGT